jgi:hypothetical protein
VRATAAGGAAVSDFRLLLQEDRLLAIKEQFDMLDADAKVRVAACIQEHLQRQLRQATRNSTKSKQLAQGTEAAMRLCAVCDAASARVSGARATPTFRSLRATATFSSLNPSAQPLPPSAAGDLCLCLSMLTIAQ